MKIFLFALFLLLNLSASALAAINLNTATFLELEKIKGIGPVKAKAIMDYRRQHGDFNTVDELDNVKGIGESTVAKLKQQLFVPAKQKLSKTASPTPAAQSSVQSVQQKNLNTKPIRSDRPAKEPATAANTK